MCDTIEGELLVSFHTRDAAAGLLMDRIGGGAIEHVRLESNLRHYLAQLGLKQRPLDLEFCRLLVPRGQEAFKMNYLQFFYKHALLDALGSGRMDPVKHHDILGRSDFHLQVVPHSRLTVSATNASAFQLDAIHKTYETMLNVSSSTGTGKDRSVLILDTGIDKTKGFNLLKECNFVDHANANDAGDDNGHGTVVASIIEKLSPDVSLIVYKVADSAGRVSEWDLLAGLAAQSTAHVVNISLEFGLGDKRCPVCGRESQQTRSSVFENLVLQTLRDDTGPLIVAAAGNSTKHELSFPARFGKVLAIESVNSRSYLSQFSNRSTMNEAGGSHGNVFLAPGGDDAAPEESVGSSTFSKSYFGTSFAAAYATGLATRVWSEPGNLARNRDEILDHLKLRADRSFATYDPLVHGNGILRA